MADIFVVRNQLGHYWGKKKCWVDGWNPESILHWTYQDEALNMLFELSSRDVQLRGEVVATALSEKGVPQVAPSDNPLVAEPGREMQAPEPETQENA
ncbi:MAG: hypothetical protein HRT77_05915 [Halioglobus sp.]|nr:hypothetical protein [Halioglobus sp.]